ncbi:hypothetical protein RRG08_007314 [Elysia crispata]|uniref:Uncharacterized protein n=1 Tax=Elysia crispata TaxID=231223 RepID=A0AAE1DJK3_9GAST|nr:hypothetical protein RRG08_007314 [Elysia crispata]
MTSTIALYFSEKAQTDILFSNDLPRTSRKHHSFIELARKVKHFPGLGYSLVSVSCYVKSPRLLMWRSYVGIIACCGVVLVPADVAEERISLLDH